jgi:hypothetical protein
MSRFRSRFRAGEWVEVRSKQEVLATLDAGGALDKLPFMPEMLRYCGQRFQVFASAHKTCDTVNKTGGRRMRGAVHLEGLRCDGSAHGGCQASCLLFWKEAWLKPVDGVAAAVSARQAGCDEATLQARVRQPGDDPNDPTYACQATRLYEATSPLKRWWPRQYLADVLSGNVKPGEALEVIFLALIFNLREVNIGYRFTRWLYDRVHQAVRGTPSPYGTGVIAPGVQTPNLQQNLQVGEIVRVKQHHEILATLDRRNRNRGLSFDKEMVRYCGKELRVGARVSQIVNESTGKMLRMPNPSLILEGAYCTSHYSERRLLCPRRIVPYWREIWVERTGAGPAGVTESPVVVVRPPARPQG